MTLFSPKEAAGQIMTLRHGLSNETLWSAVVLAAVLNALLISLGLQLVPPTPEQIAITPPIFFKPGMLAVLGTGVFVLIIFVLFWAGRALGGNGRLHDMLATFTWLQLVQAGVQVIVIILTLVAVGLASMVHFIAFFWGVWILIAFIDRVHGFNNPLKAVSVLALAFGLMMAGLVLFVLMVGALGEGMTG
ncbi:Yip1 family protein [Alisedimentitalea sp. MJ-SS2]|uniref:Yip1 family protein n=1 Tax=Aliisedimentitalea sp. MJ-SS2 TaxID=3049795 RepID=UPI002909A7D1|nr:Yip1 family protein [Alisedimentitalea sp. MJ-SS2]MDU8926958.1 Yip1 family protein [Alisedimentitalea sp. MJ-SS2]